jgi:hypothetical protein
MKMLIRLEGAHVFYVSAFSRVEHLRADVRKEPPGCIKLLGGSPAGAACNNTVAGEVKEVGTMVTHKGECFCGAVQIEVSGEPEGMGYCHCRSCRSWSAGPVNAFTLWKPDAVRVTAGAEHVGMFQKTAGSQRQYCKKCGGHLMTNHPPLGLVDVYAAKLPTLKFSPGVHINYAETVLPIRDGLPKFKDFPAEFGGSGEQIAE